MMNKTVQNSVKRMKNEQNRQVAYNMPIVNKDMKKNDEMVRKFFENIKTWWKIISFSSCKLKFLLYNADK